MLPPYKMAPPKHATQVAGRFPYPQEPLIWTNADVVSGNDISRTAHAPPRHSHARNMWRKPMSRQHAPNRPPQRCTARAVELQISKSLNYSSYVHKTLQTSRGIYPKHSTNNYIQIIETKFYMNTNMYNLLKW